MSQIVKYTCKELGDAEISCIMHKSEPWFKGIEVAAVLGYERPGNAIYVHVPLKFKNTLAFLHKASQIPKTVICDLSELKAHWINEAGLYKLVLKSRVKHAEVFQDWVCSEVLPSIRKTGCYNGNYPYRRDNITKEEVEQFADGREDRLHYDVVKHVKTRYPDAVLLAGLGEHLTTLHSRMDATNKGYTSGQPDIMILRGLPNGFQDVLAIEFKNPNGKGRLSNKQEDYHKYLKEQSNIDTIVGSIYEDIIIEMHDHYKTVFAKTQTPAIQDKANAHNFAKNENPQYWCKKLGSKPALLEECEKRNISAHEVYIKSNREIASILITFDKEFRNC